MGFGAALGSIVGGALQARGASRAADAQAAAAREQLALQREMWNTTREDASPFREAGGNALAAYMYEMGLGDAPTIGGTPMQIETITGGTGGGGGGAQWQGSDMGNMREGGTSFNSLQQLLGGGGQNGATTYRVGGQTFNTMEEAQAYANANMTGGTTYQGISMSPGAQFALNQGTDAIQSSAAAQGGLRSGNALQALEQFRFGLSSQDRDSQLNRLAGLTDMGMGAATLNAQNNNAMANMGSNALANMGNAQAAGAIGQGNAWGSALGSLAGVYGYMGRK